MPKRRTIDTTPNMGKAQPPKPKGQNHSEWLITINANKAFPTRDSPGFAEMTKRLEFLGDYLLSKKVILRCLKYGKDGDNILDGVTLDRADHEKLIDEIDPERVASVEWNPAQSGMKRLHLHATFSIKHRTYIQISPEAVRKIASVVLKMPANPASGRYPFHVDISGKNAGKEYKRYVKKNATE